MANGKTFLDFIVDAKNDRELAMAFMNLMDPEDIVPFFQEHGYDIKADDVGKIVEVRQLFAEMPPPKEGDRY
jgi:predicted ribosomally synthesized peptide with nif11-like leader